MKLYCPSPDCAKPTEYASGIKPKFCSHCGANFDAAFAGTVTKKSTLKSPLKHKVAEIEDDYDEDEERPRHKIEVVPFTIEVVGGEQDTTTLGSWGQLKPNQSSFKRPKSKIGKKKTVENLLDSAKPARNSHTIGGED